MASRVGGTVLALTAASLFAVTLATGSWWSGHPDINGQTIAAKSVHIGVLIAEGCNTGGDGECKPLDLGGGFNVTRYAVGGACALALLSMLGIALLTLKRSERRKLFAGLAFGCVVLGVITAGLLLVQGPDLKTAQKVSVPLSWGLYVFSGGIVMAFISGLVALRPLPPAPPRIVLAPPGWSGQPQQGMPMQGMQQGMPMQGMPPPPPPQEVDMAALMQENALRPSEPMMHNRAPQHSAMPPSPGGILPGPSGPLGVPSQPLFQSAPQLRPLYEANPQQGGTSGLVPQAPVPLPMRPPTPVPRSQISARHGIPTPPPLEVPPPLQRSKPTTKPPPPRAKPMTAPPPMPPRSTPDPTRPPPRQTKPPFPSPDARKPSPTKPPPTKPPSPTKPPMPAPPKIAFPPLPPRLEEPPTRDSFDEAATRAHVKEDAFDAAETHLPPEQVTPPTNTVDDDLSTQAQSSLGVGDHTDVNASAAPQFGENTSPAAASYEPSDQQMQDAIDDAARRAATDTDMMQMGPRPADAIPAAIVAPDPVQAAARAPFGPPAVKIATPLPPLAPPPPPAEAKQSMSTAPESLPPPNERQAATSGPSPACPQCESPMAWVEAHLRFYCKSCKMYF